MSDTRIQVMIDRRYCGPKASANGGYAAGVFAQAIDGPAQVTLKSPVLFQTPIEIGPDADDAAKYIAAAGGIEIAVIESASVVVDPPPLPTHEEIKNAEQSYLRDEGMTLLYPYCFVCGKKRKAQDGLHIFAGPVSGGPVNAAFWAPRNDLAGADGLVASEYLWAALDCPGAFALRLADGFVLLGRFAVDIRRRPAPGEHLIAAAWRTGQERRKHYSSSALYDEDRNIIAAANATWIEIADPARAAKLREENA